MTKQHEIPGLPPPNFVGNEAMADESVGKVLVKPDSDSDYRAYSAISYSTLATFSQSPDHLFLPRKQTWACQMGIATEMLVYDKLYGTNQFASKFFMSKTSGLIPDRLLEAVLAQTDLSLLIVWNKPDKKTGEVQKNKKHERMHTLIDECKDNPAKMPVCRDDFRIIHTMAENMLKIDVESDFGNIRLADFLADAETQEPLVWKKYGVEKKALPDFLVKKSRNFLFDLKTAASFHFFERMLRSKYWIQDQHYHEGAEELFGVCEPMVFIVLSKEKPYLARTFKLKKEDRKQAGIEYAKLIKRYLAWKKNGSQPVGWLPMRKIKLYFE